MGWPSSVFLPINEESRLNYVKRLSWKVYDFRSLSTIDELLSDEPINRILCLGNEEPKGKAYRQHTRINHVGGIIPTETATGKTGIYIPPTPPMVA